MLVLALITPTSRVLLDEERAVVKSRTAAGTADAPLRPRTLASELGVLAVEVCELSAFVVEVQALERARQLAAIAAVPVARFGVVRAVRAVAHAF